MISPDCPDCRKFSRNGDFFHSKESWDMYHNGRIHNDWQPREEIQDMLDRMKKTWDKVNALTEKPSSINDKVLYAMLKMV